jgi:hypothetical protein
MNNDEKRESQRINPSWPEPFARFYIEAEKRMRQGHRTYGDRSFDRPLFTLLNEIEEELLDAPNWAAIAWNKLNVLRSKIRLLEDRLDEESMDDLLEDLS